MKLIKKVFSGVIKAIDERERTITAVVSTNAVDRMGDILDPIGADLKNFKKNPIVLWAHDYATPPIAKALWIKKGAEGLTSKMKFTSTAFGQEIFDLYKEGFMSAFSVGFIPVESEPVKEGGSDWGPQRFKKWELLEYSAVPVPANPEALSLAMQKGIISEETKASLEKLVDNDPGDEDEEPNEEDPEDDKSAEGEDVVEDNEKITEPEGKGLDDILAENKLLEDEVVALREENAQLRYEVYERILKQKKEMPEITVGDLADKFTKIIDGVVRQKQGKVS